MSNKIEVPRRLVELTVSFRLDHENVAELRALLAKPTAPAQKVCIECGQPYCLGVCVERGDEQEVPNYEQ